MDTFDVTITYNTMRDPTAIVNNNVLTTQYLVDWLYPVGAIYTSMNNLNPSLLFGGTLTQIEDKFLLCSTSSSMTTCDS